MSSPSVSRRVVSFGKFEANLVARELRKNGSKIHLQDQPFQVLALLLENPEQAVTREELRQKLWSTDTFVDFDNGLNTAINKIREALGDSAENPRFIETLPRRGYRFIAPVAFDGASCDAADSTLAPVALPAKQWRLWFVSAVGCLFALAMIAFAFLHFHRELATGQVVRFDISVPANLSALGYVAVSPNGQNIVFVAGSADGQTHLWLRSLETLEARMLDGTDGAFLWPFWSPDSRYVAFFAQGKLKKIASSGAQRRCFARPTQLRAVHGTSKTGSFSGQMRGLNRSLHRAAHRRSSRVERVPSLHFSCPTVAISFTCVTWALKTAVAVFTSAPWMPSRRISRRTNCYPTTRWWLTRPLRTRTLENLSLCGEPRQRLAQSAH